MKKVVVSILAALYLCSTAGATVHLHYCMGELVNWSLAKSEGDKCGDCGMDKDGGCCKDEHKFVKNNADQKTTYSSIQFIKVLAVASPVAVFALSEHYSSLILEYPLRHAPPISGREIYLLNCVFRI